MSADTESARETKTKHLLMEGMVMQDLQKERKVEVRRGQGGKKECKAFGWQAGAKGRAVKQTTEGERERHKGEETLKGVDRFYLRCHVGQIVQSPHPGYAAFHFTYIFTGVHNSTSDSRTSLGRIHLDQPGTSTSLQTLRKCIYLT